MNFNLPKLDDPNDRWLTTADIEQLFKIVPRTVGRWRAEGLPFINPPRPYTQQTVLIDWLANRKRKMKAKPTKKKK